MKIQGLRHGCQYFGYILWFDSGEIVAIGGFYRRVGIVKAAKTHAKIVHPNPPCARAPTHSHAPSRPRNASGQSLVTSCAIFSKAPIYASHAALSCATDSVHSSSRPGGRSVSLVDAVPAKGTVIARGPGRVPVRGWIGVFDAGTGRHGRGISQFVGSFSGAGRVDAPRNRCNCVGRVHAGTPQTRG